MFHQCFCNCSPAPSVAVKWWPAPPLRPSLAVALAVLDRLGRRSPLRASHPVRKARKRTKRKTKMVSKLMTFFFSLYLSENCTSNMLKELMANTNGKFLVTWWLLSWLTDNR